MQCVNEYGQFYHSENVPNSIGNDRTSWMYADFRSLLYLGMFLRIFCN